MHRWKISFVVLVLLFILARQATSAEQILVAAGSLWKYNDSGSNLATGWKAVGYSDASWLTGAAQLGYGDGGESTVLSYGGNPTNRYVTYYFRHSFTVSNPATFAALTARYVRDDGAVIYLNGAEVIRSNMPSGTVSYTTLATTAIGGADESAWLSAPIDPALLVPGNNVIAVEIHQQSPSSSDISFDFELRATEAQSPAPAVTLLSPTHQGQSNSTTVSFSASASASAMPASATLFVGGPPRTVTFSGSSQVQDAQITADSPGTANGNAAQINVDGQTPHAHGLIKVPSLIGAGSGQVPPGVIVTSATLLLNCTNSGNVMQLFRLTQDWVEDQATWNQRAAGTPWPSAGADGAGSNAGVALPGDCTGPGQRSINVTQFVQEWSSGAPNYGLLITDSGTDGVDFSSSESANSPVLTVVYKSNQHPLVTQPLSGSSAILNFPANLPLGATYYWNVLVTDGAGRQSWAPSDFELTLDAAIPNEPVLISPNNGAGDVSLPVSLAATVSDLGGGALNATFSLRRKPANEFTIIALPDTQHYSEAFPAIFTSQTQWIVANKALRNIVFVTHEGDIVEHASLLSEWQAANASMSLLDNVVPYGMGPGNHDQPTTLYNQFFPYTRYEAQPWYGGHYQNLNDNNYQLFSGGGMDFVIVHLEFCPPAGAVAWASSVLKSYPNRIGIMTTHAYLNESAQRTTHGCASTQYLWDGLAVPNPNLHFMLSGHVHDESRRTDVVNGHPVFQMLADYQARPSGGEGWLRILRFVPADNRIYVSTYSPWFNRYEMDANSEFTLDFPMGGAFINAGAVSAMNDAIATIAPTGLTPNTEYEWRMTVTNSSGKTRTGPVWSFTTGADSTPNGAPGANDQSLNLNEDAVTAITLSAADPDGNPLTYAVVGMPSHGTLTGAPPNVVYQPAANYNGTDSFTFRANDGRVNSNTATVSISVLPVNDPPTAAANSYSVAAGGSLSVAAPGVLSNDADVDTPALTAQLVTGAANGVLNLNANGSFTFTPAAGYSGLDSFSYRASDGSLQSAVTTVNLTITPAAPVTILAANFNTDANGFVYADNVFRNATQSAYASGTRVSTGGFTGGALRVLLGGIDNNAVNGISGGWRRTFTLSAPTSVVLSFRYNLDQGFDYDSDERSQVLASLNGVLKAPPPNDYIVQIVGNGDGGANIGTGWRLLQISLGVLPAGTHTLIIGGYNSKKTSSSERTTVLIDDVSVTSQP